jgi:hypothetical protein
MTTCAGKHDEQWDRESPRTAAAHDPATHRTYREDTCGAADQLVGTLLETADPEIELEPVAPLDAGHRFRRQPASPWLVLSSSSRLRSQRYTRV